jgi:hypothetical protein
MSQTGYPIPAHRLAPVETAGLLCTPGTVVTAQSPNADMARCHEVMGDYGWSMVKACVDQDLEAERALEQLENSAEK